MAEVMVGAPEAPERVNFIGRIFGVLVSPKPTFQSIARRPNWLAPVVLLCLLFLAVVAIFGYRGGWPSYFQQQIAHNSRFEQMSPEQQRQVYEAQLKYGPPIAYLEAPIVPTLLVVVVAAIFLGVFNGLAGARLNFKTSMGIVAHAWMANAVSGLLGVIIVSIKDPASIDLQNLVASNAGAFLSSGAPKWLAALLGSVDLFSFWTMILLAIGFATAAPKELTTGKAFAWVFVIWLAFVVVKVGLTAAFA
jgi:Yip1 domain